MTTDQERAGAIPVREIERAERCETVLELAGMALSYHPLGYMIKKGVEIVAKRLVIGEVERFVADLERQLDRQSGLEPDQRRDPQPEPRPWWDRQWLPEPEPEPGLSSYCQPEPERDCQRQREAGDFEAG
jgi:hypothetical protein